MAIAMIYRCDLHIHTALSPCASADMTPANIVNMAELKGLDIIAITDHQSCGNCAAAMHQAQKGLNVTVVPGLEVNTADEIHLLCLFADLGGAQTMGRTIAENLIQRQNKPQIFGWQTYYNLDNEEIGQEEKLLIMPCRLSTQEIMAATLAAGGACIPAHIDRSSFSLLATFGAIPPDMSLDWLEISATADPDALRKKHPEIGHYKLIRGSDAHRLGDIAEPGWPVELPQAGSAQDMAVNLISALRPVSEQ